MHADVASLLSRLDLDPAPLRGASGLAARTPIDGALLAHVPQTSPGSFADAIARAKAQQRSWQAVPAPHRGELVRRYGMRCARAKMRWVCW